MELAARTRTAATTISVIIPAGDEQPTVAGVIGGLERQLVDHIGLVDEIVVVDADSPARTADEARAAGARVVRQADSLSHPGAPRGACGAAQRPGRTSAELQQIR